MKRKVIAMLLALSLAFTFAGCASDEKSSDTSDKTEDSETASDTEIKVSDISDEDLDSIVSLGEYKDLKIELDGDYSEDEDALNDYIDNMLTASYEKDESKDVVEEDSIVNVDFVGKKDGVAFDGGTAAGVNIDVAGNKEAGGSGGYIDGFSEGLIGAKVGEVIDCDVTFPDNYGSEELAGQAVVFTFTINYICKEIKLDHSQLTDEYVSENFGKDTVEEFREYALSSLKSDNETSKKSELQSKVMDAILDGSSVSEFPEELLEERLSDYRSQFESSLSEGESLEDYVKENYDIDMDEFETRCEETVKSNLQTELILLAIASREDITFTESDFDSYIESMISYMGLSSRDDVYGSYSTTAEGGKNYLMRIFMCNKTLSWCVDLAAAAS